VRSGYEKFAAATAAPTGAVLFDPRQEFIVPAFPFDILPGVVHDFVDMKSIAMGADPSALAMATLAAFSGAIHHRFRVKMMRNNDWWEHLRLWLLLFGRSSWLKSPILEAVMRPIKRYQVELQREYRTRKREYEEQKEAGNDDAEEPEPPERFTVGDATIEKLGEILSRYPQISVAQLFPCWEHQVGDFPWMVRAPAQESHRSAVASRMSLG
jgi:hypothetical protein